MIVLYFIRVFALQVDEAQRHVAILRRSGNWRTKINFFPSNDRAEIQFRPAQQDKIILQELTILDVQTKIRPDYVFTSLSAICKYFNRST